MNPPSRLPYRVLPDSDVSRRDALDHRCGPASQQRHRGQDGEHEPRATGWHDRDSIPPELESPSRTALRRQESAMRNRWTARLVGIAFATALVSTGVHAQQAKMFGAVSDETGAGVPNVKVILEPIEGGARVEVVTKGKKGSYLIGIVRPGRYTLKVDVAGLSLISIKGEGTVLNDYNKRESKWKLDPKARPGQPTEINVEDGMEIVCDFVVGKATEVTTATGAKAVAAGDQAYAALAQQVQKGDCVGALPQIEKFTTDNPTNGRAFYLQGFCDAVLEHDEDAIVALTKSVELDASFAGPYTLIGKVHARNTRLAEAEVAFAKELAGANIPPEIQIDALLSLGAVQRDQSKDAEAIATFEKAMAAAPTRPESYVELSALYAKMGQTDKAAATLDKAKEV